MPESYYFNLIVVLWQVGTFLDQFAAMSSCVNELYANLIFTALIHSQDNVHVQTSHLQVKCTCIMLLHVRSKLRT